MWALYISVLVCVPFATSFFVHSLTMSRFSTEMNSAVPQDPETAALIFKAKVVLPISSETVIPSNLPLSLMLYVERSGTEKTGNSERLLSKFLAPTL